MSRPEQKAILLVENESLVSKGRAKGLEDFGYTVLRAGSGEQAVETVAKTPGIDLVLMDIEPGDEMDGAQTARKILEKHDLPLVFLLSSLDKETLKIVDEISSYGLLTKSSSEAEVNLSVKMALRFFEAHENIRKELAGQKARYESIWNEAPVSIWEEDWSGVIPILDQLKEQGIQEYGTYFQQHPEVVEEALRTVKIRDVNEETVRMFRGRDKSDFMNSLETVFATPDTRPGFIGELIALAEGHRTYRTEMRLRSVDKKLVEVLLGMSFFPKNTMHGTVLVSIIDITQRKRAEEEIKKQLSEKELILKEVNHRIKNNFATVESLLQLQTQSIDHPETQSALQDAVARVQSMRVLYEQLLISEEQEELSVKHYIESLADSIVASFPGADRITMEKQIADFSLASNRLFNVGIMINELLTNAMKYAFRDKETGKLMVSVGKVDSKVTLTVQDDGNGLPEGFDASQSQGFGLMLVRMISQQFNGSFDMENANGTRCSVTFEV